MDKRRTYGKAEKEKKRREKKSFSILLSIVQMGNFCEERLRFITRQPKRRHVLIGRDVNYSKIKVFSAHLTFFMAVISKIECCIHFRA